MPTHLFLGDAERDIPAVTIDAEVSATINDIKDKLQKATGMSRLQELLSLDGGPLRDDQVLSGINHGDEQYLQLAYRERGRVIIPVKRLNGEAVHISICGSDTVATIKDKIEGVTGIPPGEQVIAVAGSIRQDGQAIADYLKRQLTRHVIVHQFATITIQQRPLTFGGRDIAFNVVPSTTIGQVKRMIRDKWGVPIAQLRIDDNTGEPIRDSVTMKSCGIEKEGFLILKFKARGKLYVKADKLDGGWTSIFVTPSHTVKLVKEAVTRETSIPCGHQKLMFGGEEIIGGRLSDFLPEELVTVYVSLKQTLRVNIVDLSNKKVSISAKPWTRTV
ncbi:ubiquitin [Perkinsus chesapeaki]|uniref:Ubiquitin n=1 Tax=Perkinsus chesapeaki TaxID=330153 RepID=A0A7J6L416_PERCH|nr:ubiquitin [Perkinsus chesapeaki]